MLLEMILAPEPFLAEDAGVRSNTSVNSFVPRQFLVSGEPFSAGLNVTLKRSLTWNIHVNSLHSYILCSKQNLFFRTTEFTRKNDVYLRVILDNIFFKKKLKN